MSATGVYLLFAPGKRPCREAVLKFVAARDNIAVSHDPAGATQPRAANANDSAGKAINSNDELGWLELLKDGLTFDLRGLAPGMALPLPEVGNYFDFPDGELIDSFEAVLLAPGPHLAGGEKALPIVRGLMALACELLQDFDEIVGVVWPPSQSAMGHRYFESTISAWLDGGAFPALGLTAFSETADGGLESIGLAHFIDRELRIEPPLSYDKVAATRLGIRLVNQLILMGGVEGDERVVAPDGTQLVLRQSENRRFIRVWPD